MRTSSLCLGLLFAFGIVGPTTGVTAEARVARAAARPAPIPRTNGGAALEKQYLIEIKLARTRDNGEEEVLAKPRLVVMEGQPAVIQIGKEVLSPAAAVGLAKECPVQVGLRVAANVVRKKGRVFLDATAEISGDTTLWDKVDDAAVGLLAWRAFEAVSFGKTATSLLDAATEFVNASLAGPDGALVYSTSVRVVTAVTLEKKITLPLPRTDNGRLEIVVREWQSSAPSARTTQTSRR